MKDSGVPWQEKLPARWGGVARTLDAELGELGEHGQRYRIDFMVTWRGRQALLRSAWIVPPEEGFPRLVTCSPLPEGRP